MKRSEINRYMGEALRFTAGMKFSLPPFAFWSPRDWEDKGAEYDEIRDNRLGWDLTDFGSGEFEKIGLLLFTIRNGNPHRGTGKKTYAEKVMVVDPGQVTPYHYHKSKMEDIINRGGEDSLNVQVYGSLDEHRWDEKSPVTVAVDGRNFTVPPGTIIRLAPGESITLFQGVFHQFWSDKAKLLLGEVSMVNDDNADNFFLEKRGRFPAITEDEKPLHLLVSDYPPPGAASR
ncbi:MAG: D-lyxose/D-mannose family sugar isomerase [Spirochaetaceae bacterium]|jgi:D-lyxose ketol-isomerase|nr:D-lyxose/D-mannose family sugar isomerase [Spirochaetaceae bacterium]